MLVVCVLTRFSATTGDDEGSKQREVEDNKLLGEYYVKFKGPSEDKNYHLIPKFYSKVHVSLLIATRGHI